MPSSPRSTAYDREWGMFLSEGWAQEHYDGAHIQEHDWSEYDPDLWFLNGRSWPDTIVGPGGGTDAGGDLIAPAGHDELQYNPISSLVHANSGDRVLLRFVNLGFQQHAMTIDGLTMRVVGKDATYLKGRDGTDLSYLTNTVYIGPGESVDAIVTAPVVSSETTFLLYNRNLAYLHNPGEAGRRRPDDRDPRLPGWGHWPSDPAQHEPGLTARGVATMNRLTPTRRRLGLLAAATLAMSSMSGAATVTAAAPPESGIVCTSGTGPAGEPELHAPRDVGLRQHPRRQHDLHVELQRLGLDRLPAARADALRQPGRQRVGDPGQ